MATKAAAAFGELLRSAREDAPFRTDRELLQRFAFRGDQAAFATLFQRHAGMVLGVCRRALAGLHDAEDACQATFLLLARKARSSLWDVSIANWLYSVARRVTDNARREARRRVARERKVAESMLTLVDRPATASNLLDALDEELARLPARYREPLVLCYLEGLSRD